MEPTTVDGKVIKFFTYKELKELGRTWDRVCEVCAYGPNNEYACSHRYTCDGGAFLGVDPPAPSPKEEFLQPDLKVPEPVVEKDAFSSQVGGGHYTSMKIQPFEFSMANGLDPMQHTVIKYVTRFKTKKGLEDLKKARHVIDLMIAHFYPDAGADE